MRKFIIAASTAFLFSAGFGLGLVQMAQANGGPCWSFCRQGVEIVCCPGQNCIQAGPCI